MSKRDRIQQILDSIRPAIQSHGGDVVFVEFHRNSGTVELRLLGACESCPISMTLKDKIERRLKGSIQGVAEVRLTGCCRPVRPGWQPLSSGRRRPQFGPGTRRQLPERGEETVRHA